MIDAITNLDDKYDWPLMVYVILRLIILSETQSVISRIKIYDSCLQTITLVHAKLRWRT